MVVEVETHSPDLRIMPVDQRVDAHELRPVGVGRAEVLEELAVRVGSSRAHEDGSH